MKKVLGLTAGIMVWGVTAGLTLAAPFVSAIGYGLKKGWIKTSNWNKYL